MQVEPTFITFKIPIYSVRIYLVVGCTASQLIEHFKAKRVRITAHDTEQITETVKPSSNEAFAMQLEDQGKFLIWLSHYNRSPRSIQALVHEITHTTLNIFRHIEAEISNASEEPLCYLHDYITGECLKRLNKAL